MRTKQDIIVPKLSQAMEYIGTRRDMGQGMVELAMEEWGKQIALALFDEMNAVFDKRSFELWAELQTRIKQSFTFKIYGEVPAATKIIDKWYEQYIEKVKMVKQ